MRNRHLPSYLFEPYLEAGVDLDGIDLLKACADFYLLERLTADGRAEAKSKLSKYERELADQFVKFLELACIGEGRHYQRADEGDGCACYWNGYDCPDNEPCPNDDWVECSCDEVEHECTRDDWEMGDECNGCEAEANCTGHDAPCWDCSEHACCGYECDGCDYCTPQIDWSYHLSPDVAKFYEWNAGDVDGRHSIQRYWMDYKVSKGVKVSTVFSGLTELFEEGDWSPGYGGDAWASGARLARDYIDGKISPRVFVNMAWSLEHNNGCIFDKAWDIEGLWRVLETQANDEYDKLAGYASPDVKEMWSQRPLFRRRDGNLYSRADFSPEWLGR